MPLIINTQRIPNEPLCCWATSFLFSFHFVLQAPQLIVWIIAHTISFESLLFPSTVGLHFFLRTNYKVSKQLSRGIRTLSSSTAAAWMETSISTNFKNFSSFHHSKMKNLLKNYILLFFLLLSRWRRKGSIKFLQTRSTTTSESW